MKLGEFEKLLKLMLATSSCMLALLCDSTFVANPFLLACKAFEEMC